MIENPLKEVLVKSAILGPEDRQYLRNAESFRKARDARLQKLSDEQKIALRRFEDTGEGFDHYMVEPLDAKRFTSPDAEVAYQKAKEARKAQGIQKLIQFAKTGQNGQYWMNDHFLKGYGVSMEDLKNPHVQKAILAAVDKNDLNELRYALPDKVLPTNKDYQYDGLLEALAEGIKGGKFTDQPGTNNQKSTIAAAAPAAAPSAAPAPVKTPAPANIGNSLTLGNTDPLANVRNPFGIAEKTTGKDIGYTYTQQEIPEFAGGSNPLSEPVETPAPAEAPAPASEPKKTKTPAGLTRDETMQFLRQGYVPNSAGGFMLNEDAAANALRRMEADPNLNLGSSITDASRLRRIRNNMLNNPEYTAQARQQAADDMLYSQAMYHKQRQDAIAAKNNAAMEQYRGQLTNDARADYLRRGELDYQRSISTGAPLTPAAQWYQTYSNAEIDGNPLPDLPTEVQNGIEQGVHKFRGQLAAQQAPVAPATLKTNNPYVITQKNMDANARAYAANNSGREALNTVNNVWDPERLKAAQERYANARSGKNRLANPLTAQPAQPNVATPAATAVQPTAATATPAATTPVQPAQPNSAASAAPSTPGTDVKSPHRGNGLNKSAGVSKPLINPFLW